MSVSEPTLETVRAYLLAQANSALRRPSMHGGEIAVRLYLDAVAVACGTDRGGQERRRGGQFSGSGSRTEGREVSGCRRSSW
ncbi:hypothetical protein Mame01_05800 [Microbispora amethystogenes]|nr:hypothetical protein Mame01_05800 [Microbispora amethystogenes]